MPGTHSIGIREHGSRRGGHASQRPARDRSRRRVEGGEEEDGGEDLVLEMARRDVSSGRSGRRSVLAELRLERRSRRIYLAAYLSHALLTRGTSCYFTYYVVGVACSGLRLVKPWNAKKSNFFPGHTRFFSPVALDR